jgi:hypothetical protein
MIGEIDMAGIDGGEFADRHGGFLSRLDPLLSGQS